MSVTPGSLAALVIAVSFAAGLNVYATLLTLGVMARMQWIALPSGLEAVANGWVLGAALLLFLLEFVADKIPAVDLVWNAAQTFIRVPVAALLAYGATAHLSPGMQALATVLGASVAFLAHSTKFTARAVVSASPEPVSNIALSTLEDLGAVALTSVATHHPYAMATAALAALVLAGILARVMLHKIQRAWRGFRDNPRSTFKPGWVSPTH